MTWMNLLQHIFSQAENLVFQFQKSKGRIFLCLSPTFASPIEKPATYVHRRICREIIGTTEGNAKTVESLRCCKWTNSDSKSPPKRKNRPEDRSAENFQNGGAFWGFSEIFSLPQNGEFFKSQMGGNFIFSKNSPRDALESMQNLFPNPMYPNQNVHNFNEVLSFASTRKSNFADT